MIWAVTALAFLSFLAFSVAVMNLVFAGQRNRQQALARRLGEVAPPEVVAQNVILGLMRDQSLSSIGGLHRILARLPRIRDLELLLHRAGSPCNPGVLVLSCGTLACVGLLIAGLYGLKLMMFPVALAAGILPVIWVRFLARRRVAAFDVQFPEAVELMGRALRAGHGLGSALQMVSDEMEDPVAEEFGRTFADYSYGKSLEEALGGLVERMGLRDLKFFATAVVMQRETGGNLTEILDNISYIIRERFQLQRQMKALSAQGKLSGNILSLLAPGLFAGLWFVSPGYMQILFDHPWGEPMLMAGGFFQLLGMGIIRKMTQFKA